VAIADAVAGDADLDAADRVGDGHDAVEADLGGELDGDIAQFAHGLRDAGEAGVLEQRIHRRLLHRGRDGAVLAGALGYGDAEVAGEGDDGHVPGCGGDVHEEVDVVAAPAVGFGAAFVEERGRLRAALVRPHDEDAERLVVRVGADRGRVDLRGALQGDGAGAHPVEHVPHEESRDRRGGDEDDGEPDPEAPQDPGGPAARRRRCVPGERRAVGV